MRQIEIVQVDNDLIEHSEMWNGDRSSYGMCIFHMPQGLILQLDNDSEDRSAFKHEWLHAMCDGPVEDVDIESIDDTLVCEIL